MNTPRREKIVLLGMMGKMHVAGAVWQTLHYLTGLERLGYDVYYVEAHGGKTWAFRQDEPAAAAFISGIMQRFGFGDRWALDAWSGSGSYYGMSAHQVKRLYDSAAAILNLHGGTIPTAEQSATGRLVYVETDPGEIQVEICKGDKAALEFLQPHCAFFTFGENYGKADCQLPVSDRFHFKPTRQPVVLDFWKDCGEPEELFTTIGAWRQLRLVEYNGCQYEWSKHLEFLKFLDLPSRTTQKFELALSRCDGDTKVLVTNNGWRFRDALSFSHDPDVYRQYIAQSKGEFTVAKDQNIQMRTGWFSDRSATYLAAGRPVITQETGFRDNLPAGEGLFSFSTMKEILAAVDAINSDYQRHSCAAVEIAREYFSHEVVLPRLLSELGIGRSRTRPITPRARVNIIGYFSNASGMGTAARRYEKALSTAGWNSNIIDVSEIGKHGPGLAGSNANINLICCDVAAYFAIRSELGDDFFRERYNIGIWLWEMLDLPEAWYDRFAYHDEIWAPSAFISSRLGPISPISVVRIPEVLEPESAGSRERGRNRFAADDGEFIFAFVFDCQSSFARKNPLAAIDAFNAAFRPHEQARLVIKCANADFDRSRFMELQRRTEGRRISIFDQHWTSSEVLDLIAACDCYVSLHRAEGVGLTIGEAMWAGKPVIATGWSGNMDFMNVSNSFPVQYRLVPLDERVAQYPSGGIWAEPSIEDAARMMRHVFQHREEAAERGSLARKEVEENYSNRTIGRTVAERIDLISKRARFQEMKQRLRTGAGCELVEQFADLGAYVPAKQLRYTELKSELRNIVSEHVPRDAGLVVVSKGDEDLLRIHSGPAWHFPLAANGKYAGHYPADSAEAICKLDEVRAQGGRFLLFPSTAFWWLDHYTDFARYVLEHGRLAHSDESCRIFELISEGAAKAEVA